MWAHPQRQGVPVARCTIERLMRENGWHGRDPGQEGTHHDRRSGRRASGLMAACAPFWPSQVLLAIQWSLSLLPLPRLFQARLPSHASSCPPPHYRQFLLHRKAEGAAHCALWPFD